MEERAAIGRLAGYLSAHRGRLAAGLVAMLAATACNLGGPLLLRAIIDRSIPAGDLRGMLALAAAYLCLVAASGALTYLELLAITRLGLGLVTELKGELFARLLSLPVSFFDEHPVGELMARTESDCEKIKELFSSSGIALASSSLLLLGMLGVSFALEPLAAACLGAAIPPLLALVVRFYDRLRPMYDESRRLWAGICASAAEFIQGFEVIRAFGRERWARDSLDAKGRRMRDNDARAGLLEIGAMGMVGFLVGPAFLAALVLLASPRILSGAMSLGTLLVFIDYGARLFDPVMGIAENLRGVQQARVALGRIFGLLELPPEPGSRPAGGAGGDPPSFAGSIEFRHVWFAYRGEDWVLEDLSFEMPLGSTTALVGPSGSGKTTAVGLLCRFYRPQRGQILVDGRPLEELDLALWRRMLGLVLQESYLFPGTVLENIRLYDESLDEAQVCRALEAAQAADFVAALPEGLGSVLRERGSNLSAGEKQLLSFARALAFDPRVVVLDEATASVDADTERRIREGMAGLLAGRTALVVAHRLSSVMGADQILYFKEGRILARGRHEELLAASGEYAELVRLQFLDAARAPEALHG